MNIVLINFVLLLPTSYLLLTTTHYLRRMQRNYILNQEISQRKMLRMAYEILENNYEENELILAGIRESGSVIARNIQKLLHEIKNISTELLMVTLDKKFPEEVVLSKPISFENKVVILIDDVSNSGKTLLYALKPFLSSHPKKIQTLVLVERTHKAFPVKPDYVGLSVATTLQEHIYVEVDGDVVKGAWME
ncbi:MAG TPA: phosphoribosyltransferase family protein [Puia sp.]|nr:phosphoribosyltransferase family protein [Puia sp.]